MAKLQLYTESKTIKLTKQQVNSLNVLKLYNVDVSRFIKRSVKPIGQLCCRWDVSDSFYTYIFNKVNNYSYTKDIIKIKFVYLQYAKSV